MNKSEQAKILPEAETAERNDSIAGFENPEALAEAYKSLQAEFTRRSQKLKQTERKLEELMLQEEQPKQEAQASPIQQEENDFESFLKQFPEADAEAVVMDVVSNGDLKKGAFTRQYVRALKEQIDALKEENSSEEAIARKALESDVAIEAVVREYLKGVKQAGKSAPPIVSGSAPVVPPSKPKSIKEAGKLFGDYFKI